MSADDDVECLWQGDKAIVADASFEGHHHTGHYADELSDEDSVSSEELTWRWDPEISLSDWTVQIVIRDGSMVANNMANDNHHSRHNHRNNNNNNNSNMNGTGIHHTFSNDSERSSRDKYEPATPAIPRVLSHASSSVADTQPYETRTYHVHKSVLGVGPKKSAYFAREFSPKTPRKSTALRQAMQNNSPTAVAAVAVAAVEDGVEPCDFFQEGMHEAARLSKAQLPASVSQWANAGNESNMPPGTSRLLLLPLQAAAFEVLLDYMYSSTGHLEITTAQAVALASLSACLEIKALRRLAREFYLKDMTMDNLCRYYHDAVVLREDAVLQAAEDHCAAHIFHVHETAVVEILRQVDADFFLRCITHDKIMEHAVANAAAVSGATSSGSNSGSGSSGSDPNNSHNHKSSLRLSLLTAVYGNLHKHELDSTQFYKLTAVSHLPAIEAKAAKVLLELEDDICFLERNPKRVSSLQERCIAVLGNNWDEACVDPADVHRVSLPRLEGVALEEFAQATMSNAKERLDKTEQERDGLKRRSQEERENFGQLHKQERESMVQRNQELERQLQESAKQLAQQTERVAALEQQERDRLAALEQKQREKQAASEQRERARVEKEREALAAFEQKRRDSIPKSSMGKSKLMAARYEQAISSPADEF
jgi:hypothetical protein